MNNNNNNANMNPQALAFNAQTSTQPRVAYYISRNNGVLVPLIPVDELPYSVRLQGVPRTLRSDQILGMQYVATLPLTGTTFKLQDEVSTIRSTSQSTSISHSRTRSNSPCTPFRAPDALARQALANSSAGAGAGNGTSQHPLPPRPMSAHELATQQWRRPQVPTSSEKTQATIDAIVAVTHGTNTVRSTTPPPPSGHIPDQEKKKYCTYWIRTGECDYMQQGCLYLHEMPDLDTLRSIGFRGTPRWWIEKTQKVRMGGVKTALTREKQTSPETSPASSVQDGKSTNRTNSTPPTSCNFDASSNDSETKDLSGVTMAGLIGANPAASPSSVNSVLTQVAQPSETDDLIDLDDSKVVAPSPSTSPNTVPSCTEDDREETIATKPVLEAKTEVDVKAGSPTKIFVPAGESAEVHIAQAKKRASRTLTVPSGSLKTAQVPALQKQIQSLQKSTHAGLRASRYATTDTSDSASKLPGAMSRKRVPTRVLNGKSIRGPEPVIVKLPGGETSS